MLSISNAQMDAFDAMEFRAFETGLAEHLETHFPWGKAFWPDGSAMALATFAHTRARHYGFVTERSIYMFATFMPVLGSRYDENPLLPWASDKLADPIIREPIHRINQLNDRILLHLRKTNGRDGRAAVRGFRQVHHVLGTGDAPTDPVGALCAAFPQRAAASTMTGQVLGDAVAQSDAFGLEQPLGGYICAALALMYGPYYYAEPQLPLIHATLYDKGLAPAAKTQALRQAALTMITALGESVGEEA
jgi:hypothetical protein